MERQLLTTSVDGTTGGVLVTIHPEVLQFGTLCIGFTYQLAVTLLNKATRPQRFKVQCNAKKYSRKSSADATESGSNCVKAILESSIVASGLSTTMQLEMKAEYLGHCEFELVVSQSLSSVQVFRKITARVVSLDVFKSISQSLPNKDSIYSPGVKPVPAPEKPNSTSPLSSPASPSPESSSGKHLSSLPSAASLITESLLDDDDIEDLISMPMLFNQYWDPIELKMINDPALSKVLVDEQWSLQESKQHTYTMRNVRYTELENMGMYTLRTIERLRETRSKQAPGPHAEIVLTNILKTVSVDSN